MTDIAAAAREAGTVRKATADELPRLASVLARAFYDDPAIQWVLPDEARRMDMEERVFGLWLRKLWLPQDECYATEGVVGVAVWELPGKWKVSLLELLRLLPAMTRILGRRLPRVMGALSALDSNHPDELHYYLPYLGVEPEWQGRGIGAALMQPILSRCDSDGVPAYLDATAPRNRALYERHGFEVTEEFTLGKGSPPLWRMWRKPAG
jgi:GNAT superfamily N-acetyltransferase